MKKIKMAVKLIFTAVLPHIFQITIMIFMGMYLGIQVGIKSAKEGIAPDTEEFTKTITEKILSLTSLGILISSLLLIGVLYLFHKSKSRKSMKVAYRFNMIKPKKTILVFILGILCFLFSVSFINIFNIASLDSETAKALENIIIGNSFIITLLSIGIVAPICEEIIFRGSIMKNLTENISFKWAIIIQAVLFSLYHMNIVQALPTLVLGLVAGFAVYYTNSIWSGIFIHVINNILAVVISNIVSATVVISSIVFIAVMVIALVIIILLIKKLSDEKIEWISLDDEIIELDLVNELA